MSEVPLYPYPLQVGDAYSRCGHGSNVVRFFEKH